MKVVCWNNGSPDNRTGAGYGVRIAHRDRDRYFQRRWPYVTIELEDDDTVDVNLSDSFWRSCSELRSAKIGEWMLEHGLAPWPKGNPPKLRLEPVGDRKFRLSRT